MTMIIVASGIAAFLALVVRFPRHAGHATRAALHE